MGIVVSLSNAWRKNAPELAGLWNGALPDFVTAHSPRDLPAGIPVFTYHLVEPASFEADLDFLAQNCYRTLSGAELVDYLAGKLSLSERAVMLTFDDGPPHLFDVAFLIIKRQSVKVTAFVAPGVHADTGADAGIDARPMSWEEIQAIHASGLVDVQSHTLESRFAPKWPNPVPLAGCEPQLEASRRGSPLSFGEDLARSRTELEARLPGARVNQLAFPMYLGTPAAVDTANSLGFCACFWGLMPSRAVNRRGDSPFFISRLSDEFLRRLPGARRITLRHLLRERMHRISAARAWRRRYASSAAMV
jgi:hypothetical protein